MGCRDILLVEDDQDIREALRDLLQTEGFSVFEAENGKTGLELLSTIPEPCLVLLDMMMPVMNGWEFIERKRSHNDIATIPVIIVSAIAESVSDATVRGIVKKPIDVEGLLHFVREHCQQSN
jgi:DNA-binding response OmpR family regulator